MTASFVFKATKDLEENDRERRKEFKRYEMEKELKRRSEMRRMNEEERAEAKENYEKERKEMKQHAKLNHPVRTILTNQKLSHV